MIERYETKKSAEAVSANLAAPYLGPLCPARASIRDVPDRALAPLAAIWKSRTALFRVRLMGLIVEALTSNPYGIQT